MKRSNATVSRLWLGAKALAIIDEMHPISMIWLVLIFMCRSYTTTTNLQYDVSIFSFLDILSGLFCPGNSTLSELLWIPHLASGRPPLFLGRKSVLLF